MGKLVGCLMTVVVLSACAHHGAVRVDCDGSLRPINPPSALHDPVQIVPAPQSNSPPEEKRP